MNRVENVKLTTELGPMRATADVALAHIAGCNAIRRIWQHDHTAWKPTGAEIVNRLGWLDVARRMRTEVGRFVDLAAEVHAAGYTHVLLLGMGGSSLAPELFAKTFGSSAAAGQQPSLDLSVVDTTDPDAVLSLAEAADPARALWVVSTKSGGTVETFSLMRYFFARASAALGQAGAGEHFVAITDPGSALDELAATWRFRAVLHGDPNIGGRYSALSPFGLVPAALVGVDLERLLASADEMATLCGPDTPVDENPAARLGVVMAELARAGRDKLTLVFPRGGLHTSFGDWVEQLVAESTGKEGKGILPVVGEPLASPSRYGHDRLFVCFDLEGRADPLVDQQLATLAAARHPVVRVRLDDLYDLGGQLFLWELATAVAGHCLQINPFDQPNVESAKVVARKVVAAFKETGTLPQPSPSLRAGGLAVYGDVPGSSAADALVAFLDRIRPPEYLSIHAYLPPSEATSAALAALRTRLRDNLGVAVTVGYGPRFLHSTGQLHKGDAGRGRFLQLTADAVRNATIPDEMGSPEGGGSLSFGVLELAQALGDRQALLDADRKVLRVHLGRDIEGGLALLARPFDPRPSIIPPR
jgi:transaldolase / glucose-6-phosphate isomerase